MRLGRTVLCLVGLIAVVFGQSAPRRLSRGESMSAVVNKVAPEYPQIAKQLKLEGAVDLEVTVAESGVVEAVKIVSGNPVLTRPAVDAVKKWRFEPQTDGGKPIKALAEVTISFKL